MMHNDLEMITQARQAFISGDLAHGGKIVHGVLKSDIHHAEAWSLLYTYLGRGRPFDEFQEFFVRKYYPEKYHEFLARRAMFTSSPYRRVSIVPAPPEDQEEAEARAERRGARRERQRLAREHDKKADTAALRRIQAAKASYD